MYQLRCQDGSLLRRRTCTRGCGPGPEQCQCLLDRLQVQPAFPLGYGPSYGTFRLHHASISAEPTADSGMATENVSCTGTSPGRYVIQVYGSCSVPNEAATRVLLGFSTLDLEANGVPTEARVGLSLKGIKRWRIGSFVFPSSEAGIEGREYVGDPERVVLPHHVRSATAKIDGFINPSVADQTRFSVSMAC